MTTIFSIIITTLSILIMMELMPPMMIALFTWAGVFVMVKGGLGWISQQHI